MLAVGLVGVLSTLLVTALLMAAVAIAGQRARTAADLAALGAAGAALSGADRAGSCAVAGEVATANGAVLTSCDLLPASTSRKPGLRSGPSSRDQVSVTSADAVVGPAVELTVTRHVAGTAWTVRARARAGGVLVP